MKKFNAREMRHEVEVLADQREPDGAGGWIKPNFLVRTTRAKIRPLSSYERFQAQQVAILSRMNNHALPADLTSSHKLRYRDRVFEIIGTPINVEELNRLTRCICAEVIKQ